MLEPAHGNSAGGMALFSVGRTGKVPIFLPYCDGLKMKLLSANLDDEARTYW
jgi:hypothetical protein